MRDYSVLNRRKVARSLLTGMVVFLCSSMRRVEAQSATPAASHAPDLARLFPDGRVLPSGLELESAGARDEIGQLAGTFRNSRDAAQLLAGWGWVENAYRSYAASAGAGNDVPAQVEISLHRFTSSTGAAYALSYFAHDRAVVFQHHEGITGFLLPCQAIVTGEGSATRFLRQGNLVVRVTVVMPSSVEKEAGAVALTIATDLALAVLANAGKSAPERHASC